MTCRLAVVSSYVQLAIGRRTCRACNGLRNPAEIDGGRFDSSELGPWTLWQGNVEAALVVVGQDWGDVASFVRNEGFEEPGNPTNARLAELLALAGVPIVAPTRLSRAGTVFFTNAILCLKSGGLQATVKQEWFSECGRRFLRPTIELVAPVAVVALGTHATRAVCDAFAITCPKRFSAAVDDIDGIALPNGPTLFPRYHCGARSTNMNRGRNEQNADWIRLGRWLAQHARAAGAR